MLRVETAELILPKFKSYTFRIVTDCVLFSPILSSNGDSTA